MGMPATALGAQIAGAAFTAYSAFSQSSSSKAAYQYQAAVNENNAKIAEWNAQDAARRGEQDLIDQRRRAAQTMGTQRATLAGRGIDISEGSALNILTDTEYMSQQDSLTVKDNTAKSVWGAKVQANNDRANAGLYQMKADNESPFLSGVGSLLTSAPKVSDAWNTYKGIK